MCLMIYSEWGCIQMLLWVRKRNKKNFLLGQPMKIKRYLPEQDKVSVITSEKGHNDA